MFFSDAVSQISRMTALYIRTA